MDSKSITILNILQRNARLSFREVAKKAKTSVVTVINRVKELEQNKIIIGYSAELDYEKLGYDVQAIINLRIIQGKLFEIEKKVATHPNVFAVYDTTGDYDALIIAKFKNRRGLDKFLKKIQTFDFIAKTKTSIILNTIKEQQIKVEN